jgi:hypothetical protein
MSRSTWQRANFGLTENTDRYAERQVSGAAGSRRLHAVVIQRPPTPYEGPGVAMATGDAPPVSPALLAVG